MSIKQINRDFTVTQAMVGSSTTREWTSRPAERGCVEHSMRWVERECSSIAARLEPCMIRGEIAGIIRCERLFAASRVGVVVSTTTSLGLRRSGSRYIVPIMRYAMTDAGWAWSCPLVVKLDRIDPHWKSVVQRDNWNRYVKRLTAVCAEASVFAHAFRHGA